MGQGNVLHLSVILFTRWGGCVTKHAMAREGCVSQHAMGVYTPLDTPPPGRHPPGPPTPPPPEADTTTLGRHPPEMATETGSAHPTGMHYYY